MQHFVNLSKFGNGLARKIGCTAQTLRTWVPKTEAEMVASASEPARLKQLER